MRYRFRVSKKQSFTSPKRPRRACLRGRARLRRKTPLPEPIETISFFEFGEIPEEASKRKRTPRQRGRKLSALLSRVGIRFRHVIHQLGSKLGYLWRNRRRSKKEPPHLLSLLSGALCGALLISAFSAGGVLWGLFASYGRPYVSLTVPDFLGKAPNTVQRDERLNLIIQYEQNPEVTAGLVISQSPHPGVTRRLYGKDDRLNIVLTVSRNKAPYVLESLRGKTERDASLLLRNAGIPSAVIEEYSDLAPKGTVLDTVPPAGSTVTESDTVVLRVSLGKQILRASVPDLFGCSESEATSLLRGAGLVPGTVTYRSSAYPAGTVIEQERPAFGTAELGDAVSYTVSTGDRYTVRSVPDLYGMSVEQAAELLREYGLVVGGTYSVSGTAPSGTVVTQSPLPGAPITSSTVAVDLYVSA